MWGPSRNIWKCFFSLLIVLSMLISTSSLIGGWQGDAGSQTSLDNEESPITMQPPEGYEVMDVLDWNIETVDSVGDVGSNNELVLDGEGNPHVIYRDRWNNSLKYAKWNGSSWNVKSVLGESYGGSIVIDNSGYPHISHVNISSGKLEYAKWNGSSWNIEIIDNNMKRLEKIFLERLKEF